MTTEARSGPLRPPVPWEQIDDRRSGTRLEGSDGDEPAEPDSPAPAQPVVWALAGLTIGAAVAGYVVNPLQVRHNTLVGVVALPLILLVLLPLLLRARRIERRFDLAGIMLLGLGCRFLSAYYRLHLAADASEYNTEGARLAESFRQLDFFVPTGRDVPGTGSVRYVTGIVHLFTGSTFFVTLLVFTVIAFLGSWWFYRAFCVGFPHGDARRYAYLIFLWPPLVFWPSSIGKEALVVSALGLASLGVARLLQHRPGGLLLLGLGTAAVTMIRPHMAMMIMVAVTAALLIRRSAQPDAVLRMSARALGLTVVLVGGAILAGTTAEFLNLENLGVDQVSEALTTTVTMTGQGGSSFDAPRVTNPLLYPVAVVTVLFRPFPGEAGGLEGAVAGLTGVALAILCLASLGRVVRALGRLRTDAYLGYCLAFVLVFVFVFSVVGNFGILDRQRSQVLPFLFVLLAAPRSLGPSRRGPSPEVPEPARPLAVPDPRRHGGER